MLNLKPLLVCGVLPHTVNQVHELAIWCIDTIPSSHTLAARHALQVCYLTSLLCIRLYAFPMPLCTSLMAVCLWKEHKCDSMRVL